MQDVVAKVVHVCLSSDIELHTLRVQPAVGPAYERDTDMPILLAHHDVVAFDVPMAPVMVQIIQNLKRHSAVSDQHSEQMGASPTMGDEIAGF